MLRGYALAMVCGFFVVYNATCPSTRRRTNNMAQVLSAQTRFVARRSAFEIRMDILRVAAEGSAKPTHIMYRSNTSWIVLHKNLESLLDLGVHAAERRVLEDRVRHHGEGKGGPPRLRQTRGRPTTAAPGGGPSVTCLPRCWYRSRENRLSSRRTSLGVRIVSVESTIDSISLIGGREAQAGLASLGPSTSMST